MEQLIVGIIIVFAILVMLGGAVQTFKRNAIVAIITIIFLTPIWLLWAFVELFLEDPSKKETPLD